MQISNKVNDVPLKRTVNNQGDGSLFGREDFRYEPMIGRTPEFLGKKIGPSENKMIVICALTGPVTILTLTAIAISTKAGLASLTTNGWGAWAHGDHHFPQEPNRAFRVLLRTQRYAF